MMPLCIITARKPCQHLTCSSMTRASAARSQDGVCPCTCDYVADASCTCRNLAGALNITLSKSAVYASYPLQYVQNFNFKPYEVSARCSRRHPPSLTVIAPLRLADLRTTKSR